MRRLGRRALGLGALVMLPGGAGLLAIAGLPAGAAAQPPAAATDSAAAPAAGPPVARTVSGGVFRPDPRGDPRGEAGGDDGMQPVSGVWVTLHHVGRGSGRAVDSVRSDGAGRYSIRYLRPRTEESVFFLSTSYGGITYFSAPLADADVRGEDADLVVYDTTSGPLRLRVQGRHLVVGAVDSTGRHPVVEVWELANDSSVTLVANDERASWVAMVPPGAREFRVLGNEVSPEAVTRDGAEVRVFAPMAPGVKRVSFAYSLAAADFPLTQPAARDSVQLLEVLLEDPAGTVDGALLAEGEPVDVDGRTFRRFLAQQVPPTAVLRIDMPRPPVDSRRLYVTAVLAGLGLLMLFALARAMRRTLLPAAPGWQGMDGPAPEELARRIAALDAAFQRRRSPSLEERQEYERQRGGLKAQLTDALQRRGE